MSYNKLVQTLYSVFDLFLHEVIQFIKLEFSIYRGFTWQIVKFGISKIVSQCVKQMSEILSENFTF